MWLVQVILDCKGICAPESSKVQLTKLLTLNNVLYYNLPLPTKIYPDYPKFAISFVELKFGMMKGTLSFPHLIGDLGTWPPLCSAQSTPGRISSMVNQCLVGFGQKSIRCFSKLIAAPAYSHCSALYRNNNRVWC